MKALLLALTVLVLGACAGPTHRSGSVTVGTHGGSVSGTVSGPGGSGTVTVPVPPPK